MIKGKWGIILFLILLINFILRLVIFSETTLFSFADYKNYLTALDAVHEKGSIDLVGGNFLFTISYLGYYAKYLLGNINFFFIFNCFLGTFTTFLISVLIIKISENYKAGIFTAILLTFYTEFMVFSSVFYTPVIMLFLLSLFIFLLYKYYKTSSIKAIILQTLIIILVYIISFLFKPELVFFPAFLGLFSLFFIRIEKIFFFKSIVLTFSLVVGFLVFNSTSIYNKSEGDVIANDFVFFGHTDYGGDGGEGSFIYSQNKKRYEVAYSEYCSKNNITEPTAKQRNNFQLHEIKKFITNHPLKWIGLQFTKFFRTFGVVP
jgi:hypothetical protein